MRMMNKVMTGMSLAAVALALAGGVNAAKADAAVSAEVDAKAQTMEVTGGKKEVWVSYDAAKADKSGNITYNDAKAKWDVYDGTSAIVDLSALKFSKDVYITVKTTEGLPVVYKFKADTSKLTGKYGMDATAKTSTLIFTDEKKATIDVTQKGAPALEYRTANSNEWAAYTSKTVESFYEDSMNMYEKQGSTLYFRYAGTEFEFEQVKSANEEEATYKLYEQTAGCFAGTESKVKITKEANAPSASIDYDNGAFKVKSATMEVRNLVEGAYVYDNILGEDVTAKAGSFVTPVSDLVPIDVSTDGVFEVRTAATDKKIASKVAVYAYKGTPNLKKIGLTMEATGDSVTFNNADEVSYLVYDKDPATEAKPKAIATVKAASDKGYKPVTVKKVAAGTQLYVASASDKKTGVFRSNVMKWNVVGEEE